LVDGGGLRVRASVLVSGLTQPKLRMSWGFTVSNRDKKKKQAQTFELAPEPVREP